MASSYLTLASHAVLQLLIFPFTLDCELGFSILTNMQSKNESRLGAPGHDFRHGISKVISCFDQLMKDKQKHNAH